jgi:hypothetical protein
MDSRKKAGLDGPRFGAGWAGWIEQEKGKQPKSRVKFLEIS